MKGAKRAAPARAKRKVPEDRANELREIATMLRAGVHPDAIRPPEGSDMPCGAWLAGMLDSIAAGASISEALGLRGRPRASVRELRLIHAAYMKERIVGMTHDGAIEAAAKNVKRSQRNVEKAISEARKRGIVSKVSAASLRQVRKRVEK